MILAVIFSCAMPDGSPEEGYRVDLEVRGVSDSTLVLGFYYKNKTYAKDTAQADAGGNFIFQGEKSLKHGFYFVMLNNRILFQIVMGQDQFFSITCDRKDYVGTIQVEGSLENELFFDGLKRNVKLYKEASPFLSILKDSTHEKLVRLNAQRRVESARKKMRKYRDSLANQHPKLIISRFIRASQNISPPDTDSEGKRLNTDQRYNYLKRHYFDHIDLSDPLMLRLPEDLLERRVEEYLDKLSPPQADSIIHSIEYISGLSKDEPEMLNHLIWIFTRKYQEPEFMGLDKVMVHLHDNYYATGKMDSWANETMKKHIKKHADQVRKSLIGEVAPNLVLQDIQLKPAALYGLKNTYRVVYLYDPDCGGCKRETPRLLDFYQNTHFDVGIYAVSVDSSMQKMRDYVQEVGMQDWVNVCGARSYGQNLFETYDAARTPTLLVLNQKHEIIAKKIPSDKIEVFLENYEKIHLKKE
ncbi:MAG: thioredoxin-like domain-containing protein [Cytophagales bacterium]|nr:thioredoxin-like domain-containing protein [Cytophagales bacterium]